MSSPGQDRPAGTDPAQNDLDWLYRQIGHGIKPGLAHVRTFLERAEVPFTDGPRKFIHVAGTNGKGSVVALIHALLRAHGHRAGRFTSPHLLHYVERFRIDDQDVDHDTLHTRVRKLRQLVESWQADPVAPRPTFFELTLALALTLFEEARLPWAVLETGMGGRLDATNVVTPVACVITPIGLDHTRFLGDTIEEIAAEKAGIIKPGIPVVSSPQHPDALRVIEQTARRRNAPLTLVETPWPADRPLGLTGKHQSMNAAVALAAFELAGLPADPSLVRNAFRDVDWPARFQRFPVNPPLVLDGAHNLHAIRQLVATWRAHFPGQSATLLLGMVADKDIDPIIRALQPIARRWIASQPPPPRGLPAEQLAAIIRRTTGPDTFVEVRPRPDDAVDSALGFSDPVLATGSLFFAADILALMKNETIPRPSSAQ